MPTNIRYYSPQMAFTVFGTPSVSKGAGINLNGSRAKNATASRPTYGGGVEAYINMIRMACKAAMAEYKWTITDEPLYIVLTLYIPISRHFKKKVSEEMYKAKAPCVRLPKIKNLIDVYMKAMCGLVFKKERQIAGMLVVKQYSKEETGVDVLIGKPENLRRMLYDLRNA